MFHRVVFHDLQYVSGVHVDFNHFVGFVVRVVGLYRFFVNDRTQEVGIFRLFRLLSDGLQADPLVCIDRLRVNFFVVEVGVSDLLVWLADFSNVFLDCNGIALRRQGHDEFTIDFLSGDDVNFNLVGFANFRVNLSGNGRGVHVFFVFAFRRLYNFLKDLHQVDLGGFFRFNGLAIPVDVYQLHGGQANYCGYSCWGRLGSFRYGSVLIVVHLSHPRCRPTR